MSVFETTVKAIGKEAELFKEEKMVILFGENAPDSLADYCYNIEMKASTEEIKIGMLLSFDDSEYSITAVGKVVRKNLDDLGHITIKFDGSKEAELPGTLYVEAKKLPEIAVGTKVKIEIVIN